MTYTLAALQFASYRQQNLAMSSFEAETYAAVGAGKEAVHLARLLLSMNESSAVPVLLLGDNKPSVTVHHNLEDAKRGKALDIRSHYLRHLIASRQVDYRHIPGSENPADTMTKQEHFPAFQRMRSRMNIR